MRLNYEKHFLWIGKMEKIQEKHGQLGSTDSQKQLVTEFEA